jgi:heme/copper-type cytochrome/quinol oxidase subunit 2
VSSTPQDPFAVPDASTTPPGPPPAAEPGPAWGQQPYGTAGAAPSNGMGTAALVIGILAVLATITVIGGVVLGLVALILGFIARGKVKRGEATNGGSALAGIILGAIAVVCSIAIVAAGVSLINSDSGKKLQDCLDSAGDNQAAVEQCQREFQDDLSG